MTTTPPEHCLFLDLETTGLDEREASASLLEVGLILCERTPAFDILAEANMLIRPPGNLNDHDILWSRMNEEVRLMHQASGLWQEATTSPDGWNFTDADVALSRWLIDKTGSTTSLVQPAGSGIAQFDLRWTREFLPRLSSRFHYRPLDVSSIREGFYVAGRAELVDFAGHVEAKPHRALGDAHLHRLEAIAYLEVLRNCSGGSPKEAAAEPISV